MKTIQYVPGAIGGGATHTLPATAPDIETIVSGEIERLPAALSAHGAGAAPVAHAAGVAVTHAGADVAQHTDHNHDLISQGVAGAVGVALGFDAVAPPTEVEDAGAAALHTLAGGAATGIQNTLLSAHVPTQPNDHPAADIVVGVIDHPPADIAGAVADHVGADPVSATGAITRLTTRTFSMVNQTLAGDLLTLDYLEVGEQVLVS